MQRLRELDRPKDEEAHDPLSPRRPRLQRGRDDDVVGTGNDVIPARRVEMMALIDAGPLGQRRHVPKYVGPARWCKSRALSTRSPAAVPWSRPRSTEPASAR